MSDRPHSAARKGWKAAWLVALLVVTVWTACFRFPVVWDWLGIGEGDKPFLDLYGLLASGEAAAAGFDVSRPNPLDPYNRPNVYTDWWLVTGKLGLVRSDTGWLGIALVLATLVATLIVLKPRTPGQVAGVIGVLISPALLMAVSRANNDLIIFLLVSVALVALRARAGLWRALAMVLIAISAVLKYFPLAGAIVLLHARSRREFLSGLALFALVLLAAWPTLAAGLASAGRIKPRPEWLYAFGAPMLWRNFHLENAILWLVPAVVVCVGAAILAWRDCTGVPREIVPASTTEQREFLVGSVFVVGCFFLGASYVYKLVFALWLLPWFWRGDGPKPLARFNPATAWLLYAVLWFEGLGALVVNLIVVPMIPRAASPLLYAILTCQQALTWALIAFLLRWIFADVFVRLRNFMGRANPAVGATV